VSSVISFSGGARWGGWKQHPDEQDDSKKHCNACKAQLVRDKKWPVENKVGGRKKKASGFFDNKKAAKLAASES
jgi:hypothetical protein